MTDTEKKEPPQDDPIATYILDALSSGEEVSPNTIAQTIARDKQKESSPRDFWRKFMTAVRQQAIHLARNGRIEIVRKGEVADPNDFKGLYKLRLPRK
ncbi:DUF3253 domain-containing protein [Sneathiella limimaris]|uniref:DUF3253 domain-containing protein n=1 Tax=Sneathiella limimaris TaxID=1964213 RepID=UPI00146DF8DF|nr:DUF3253 domain-containing protein [Sneathiella limimaris]